MDYKFKLNYIRKKMPVRIAFFIILLVFFVTEYFYTGASEKMVDISTLLLNITMFMILIIVLFSIITILLPYILYMKSNTKPDIQFFYSSDNNIVCEIECKKLLYPFAGMLKADLIFDKPYSILISLVRKKRKIRGKKIILLPDIKNYELETVTVYFQDVFRMFSLQKTFRIKSSVLILPVAKDIHFIENAPVSFDDDIRTDTLHRKEGELLQFKNFESSDDIRRIVWQIYAKNKELIVRTAEMHNLYASQIDIYASFNNKYTDFLYKNIADKFLNHYKTIVWELYNSMKLNNDSKVRFIFDQTPKIAADYQHEISAKISGMNWHTNKPIDYLMNNKISVCCISSFIDYQDVEKILDSLSEHTFVVLVSLKTDKINVSTIIKEIFTIPQEKEGGKWLLSLSNITKQIKNNEKLIINALNSNNIKYTKL